MTVAQRARATASIERKGQAVTITVSTPGAYNPATGTSTPTTANITTTAALLPLSKSRMFGNSNIVAGDETLLISALDNSGDPFTEPKVGSVVTLANGGKRKIIAIDTLSPAGLDIMFDAVVRKAGQP